MAATKTIEPPVTAPSYDPENLDDVLKRLVPPPWKSKQRLSMSVSIAVDTLTFTTKKFMVDGATWLRPRIKHSWVVCKQFKGRSANTSMR